MKYLEEWVPDVIWETLVNQWITGLMGMSILPGRCSSAVCIGWYNGGGCDLIRSNRCDTETVDGQRGPDLLPALQRVPAQRLSILVRHAHTHRLTDGHSTRTHTHTHTVHAQYTSTCYAYRLVLFTHNTNTCHKDTPCPFTVLELNCSSPNL